MRDRFEVVGTFLALALFIPLLCLVWAGLALFRPGLGWVLAGRFFDSARSHMQRNTPPELWYLLVPKDYDAS